MALASPYNVAPGATITIAAADIITPTGVTLTGTLTIIVREAGLHRDNGVAPVQRAALEVASTIAATVT